MNDIKLNNTYFMALVSIGFVSLILNLFIRNEMDFSYLLIDINSISNIISINKKSIIEYIMYSRLKQMFIIIILFKAFGTAKIYNALVIIFSSFLGFMLSIQVYYIGIDGIWILLVNVLPHYIFYYFSVWYGFKVRIFSNGIREEYKKILIFCIIFVIGMVFECFFMTFFLKIFHQYMVN